ncbi:Cytochrome b-c1 complex subunit 6, mitochondrial, partial [Pseudozyma hubeiensis]
ILLFVTKARIVFELLPIIITVIISFILLDRYIPYITAFDMPSSSVTVSLPASGEESVYSSVSSFFSSLLPVAHAEEESSDDAEEESEDKESEGGDAEEEEEEEEEEDEPEDPAPAIYEDCEKSKACAPLKHHFDECTKRVEEGKGFEGENCIEEFFHLAHCAQECTAPKLFSKLV